MRRASHGESLGKRPERDKWEGKTPAETATRSEHMLKKSCQQRHRTELVPAFGSKSAGTKGGGDKEGKKKHAGRVHSRGNPS